ncbi:MAG TPA: alpha/beta fold hydrolase [Tissierellaceae bacterium]|nr:alpha/beta fold hydrolase [Tissierellaceae bacterium]
MDYPIVFIPGLFGSLGDEVIPGTGNFSFGLAEGIYKPFIKILNSIGYVEGENLFVSYYDWKNSILKSTDKYLDKDIKKVKKKTGSKKVILIGHSLGGLLGRSYMTYFSSSSVDKLIMIGTPNFGAANAYYFWSGGRLPYPRVERNILYNGIKLGFILYFQLFHNEGYLKPLRKLFPVVQDLLPSYDYGNYLYYEEDGERKEIPIEKMSVKNPFLSKLNQRPINRANTFLITGKGEETSMEFLVDLNKGKQNIWVDGEPIGVNKTNYGDGTVTTFSSLGNLGQQYIIIEGDHTNILYRSQEYLAKVLNKPISERIFIKEVEKLHLIFADNCREMEIITSDTSRISTEKSDIRDKRLQVINLGNNRFWIMAKGDKDLEVGLNMTNKVKREANIYQTSLG